MCWSMITDRSTKPLEITDEINISLVIDWCVTYKKRMPFELTKTLLNPSRTPRGYSIETRDWIFVKSYGLFSFLKNIDKL